mmetsp:Transcript_20126/g.29936  ORF Transcript_20126/g.29936 Transcript_20126/m.29936 type:complete len:208 (-) Transcript_20126:96-719(-)
MAVDESKVKKILLIGDSGVGKSSLLLRFCDGSFPECYISSIGVDFKEKTLTVKGEEVPLQVWDTAGQERFRTITSSYYRGSHGVLIVFDISDKGSFENIKDWLQEVNQYGEKDVVKVLVGNKTDLNSKRVVETELAQQLAKDLQLTYLETSAKNDEGVDQLFNHLTELMISQDQQACAGATPAGAESAPVTLQTFKTKKTKKRSCMI